MSTSALNALRRDIDDNKAVLEDLVSRVQSIQTSIGNINQRVDCQHTDDNTAVLEDLVSTVQSIQTSVGNIKQRVDCQQGVLEFILGKSRKVKTEQRYSNSVSSKTSATASPIVTSSRPTTAKASDLKTDSTTASSTASSSTSIAAHTPVSSSSQVTAKAPVFKTGSSLTKTSNSSNSSLTPHVTFATTNAVSNSSSTSSSTQASNSTSNVKSRPRSHSTSKSRTISNKQTKTRREFGHWEMYGKYVALIVSPDDTVRCLSDYYFIRTGDTGRVVSEVWKDVCGYDKVTVHWDTLARDVGVWCSCLEIV